MNATPSTISVRRILTAMLAATLTIFVAPSVSAGNPSDSQSRSKKTRKKAAKPTKPSKPKKKTRTPAKPVPKAKSETKTSRPMAKSEAKPAPEPKLQELDKLCRRDQAWGKLQAVRQRCADLEPRASAEATYWRLTLSDDPNDLRKGYAPATLGKGEVDARLLLSAGRYHFARGQTREMEDLVEIARRKKIAGAEIDTLRHLAAGK